MKNTKIRLKKEEKEEKQQEQSWKDLLGSNKLL